MHVLAMPNNPHGYVGNWTKYTNNRNRRAERAAAIEAGSELETISEEGAVVVRIVDSNEPSAR